MSNLIAAGLVTITPAFLFFKCVLEFLDNGKTESGLTIEVKDVNCFLHDAV